VPCISDVSPVGEWSTQCSVTRDHQYTAQGMYKTSSYTHTHTHTYIYIYIYIYIYPRDIWM